MAERAENRRARQGAFLLPVPRSWTKRRSDEPSCASRTRSSSETGGSKDVVVVGLQTGGVPLAERLAEMLEEIEGTAGAPRLDRRRLLPRRHRAAPRAARGGHRPALRHHRHRSSSSSTTCCSPAAPSGPPSRRSAPGARARVGAAGRHGRPRPPGAARSGPTSSARTCRPRRDETRRGGPRRRRDRRPHEHRAGKGGPMNLDELVIDKRTSAAAPPSLHHPISTARRSSRSCASRDAFAEVSERPIPKVPALRGRTVATVFMEPSTRTQALFRDGGETPLGRHDDLHRRHLGHPEGRVAARHRRDDRRHGHRRHGDPPPRLRGAAAGHRMGRLRASSTPATAPTSTRPRRCSTATRSSRRSAEPARRRRPRAT